MHKVLKKLCLWRLVLIAVVFIHYHFNLIQVSKGIHGYIFFTVALSYASILCLTQRKRRLLLNLKWLIVFVDLAIISFAVEHGGFLFWVYYLPIIAMAEQDGTKGALVTAVIAGVCFLAFQLPNIGFAAIMEMMSFLIVGLFTGVLLERRSYTFRADLPLDSLTNLPTRKTFSNLVDAMIARENLKEYAVIMLDIDDFRHFNVEHGFLQGNLVLQMIAQVIIQQIRSNDIAARYDGEEYVVFLPNTDKGIAVQIAERLRETIQAIQTSEGIVGLNVSVGVAEAPVDGEEIMSLLGSARNRMYRAKDLGGDRVVASLTE